MQMKKKNPLSWIEHYVCNMHISLMVYVAVVYVCMIK